MMEYANEESAKRALECMNLRRFGKSRLKIAFSKYSHIDLKKSNKSELSQKFNEVILVSDDMHRFVEEEELNINPTDSLLFVIENNGSVNPFDLFLHLQRSYSLVSTKVLPNDPQESDSGLQKIMFRFKNQKDSIVALSQFHNSTLQGVVLNACFSQIQI